MVTYRLSYLNCLHLQGKLLSKLFTIHQLLPSKLEGGRYPLIQTWPQELEMGEDLMSSVIMPATWEVEGIGRSPMSLSCTFILIVWQLMSRCSVCLWTMKFAVVCIELWLSQYRTTYIMHNWSRSWRIYVTSPLKTLRKHLFHAVDHQSYHPCLWSSMKK